jgi:hypothetical protein
MARRHIHQRVYLQQDTDGPGQEKQGISGGGGVGYLFFAGQIPAILIP